MRSRILVSLVSLCALALAVSVAAGGIYQLSDDELAGPEQPIEFSHQVHTGLFGIECLYCHTTADKSQHASIPAVSVCLGCHQWVKEGATPGSAEEIAKIQEFAGRGESIPWIRVHNLPEHVQFKHHRHVRAGMTCQECHGAVEEMKRVWITPDTRYNSSSAFLPAAKLEMGWCMDCHKQRQGTRDCVACHY
jgi:hypothetical protein